MHEMSVAHGLLTIIEARAREHGIVRVTRARLKIGRLRGLDARQLRLAFEALAEGGIAAGAELEIEEIAPKRAAAPAARSGARPITASIAPNARPPIRRFSRAGSCSSNPSTAGAPARGRRFAGSSGRRLSAGRQKRRTDLLAVGWRAAAGGGSACGETVKAGPPARGAARLFRGRRS